MKHPDSICFAGDVWLPSPVGFRGEIPDTIVLNLESAITTSTTPVKGKIPLKVSECHLRRLLGGRRIIASLANNHMLDYGFAGVEDTLAALAEADVPCFGLEAREHRTLLIPVGEELVALLGFCGDTGGAKLEGGLLRPRELTLDNVREDVESARGQGATRIVASVHWGIQEVAAPEPAAVELGDRLADLGVDLIVGHHAHRIQSFTRSGDTHIFYGLGNFCFSDREVAYTPETGEPIPSSRAQLPWNRRSLLVFYDVAARSAEARIARTERNGDVRLTEETADRYFRDFRKDPITEREFNRAKAMGGIGAALGSYLANPKLPRWQHVQILFGLVARSLGLGSRSTD